MIDAYAWFDSSENKIEGETLDRYVATKKGFNVDSFSFGVENPVNVGSGSSGLGSGRAEFQKINISKKTDTGTCAIILSCCAGTHHDFMHLMIRKGGSSTDTSGNQFVHVTLGDVVVESINWEGSDGDEAFSDQIVIAYAKMRFEYWEQSMDGKLKKHPGLRGEMAWNQTTNRLGDGFPSTDTKA